MADDLTPRHAASPQCRAACTAADSCEPTIGCRQELLTKAEALCRWQGVSHRVCPAWSAAAVVGGTLERWGSATSRFLKGRAPLTLRPAWPSPAGKLEPGTVSQAQWPRSSAPPADAAAEALVVLGCCLWLYNVDLAAGVQTCSAARPQVSQTQRQ